MIKKMPVSKPMPSKPARKAPPSMKKVNTDAAQRPMAAVKPPKSIRTKKI